ncbi:MAG: response regulator [Planctomycetaceae bacterium]
MLTVLVVDDALSDRVLMSGLLTKTLKCDVLEAGNGLDALSILDAKHPDVVLTDMNMPEMDGLELVAAVKENHPRTPVILMTAQGSEEIAAKAMRQGAASYVPKAKCSEHLAETVIRVVAGSNDDKLDAQVLHYLNSGSLSFSIRNNLRTIESLVALLRQTLRCLPLESETERLRVGLAVEAGLLNACLRGNLELTREATVGRRNLISAFQNRVNESPYRDRRIHLIASIDRQRAKFVISDEGNGFDSSAFSCCGDLERLPDENQTGRGIALMCSIMDEVSWNETGNELTLVKNRFESPGD